MTPLKKKGALEGAATPTKATQYLGTKTTNKEHTHVIVHIPRPGKSTGIHHVTWADEEFPMTTSVTLVASMEDARLMATSPQSVTLCEDCVVEQAEHFRELKRKEEERRRMADEREVAARHRALQEERQINLIDAYRRGDEETVKFILDDLLQEDDEALKRAGLSSWDEGLDD